MCDLDAFSQSVIECADRLGMKERVYGTPVPPCDFKTVLW